MLKLMLPLFLMLFMKKNTYSWITSSVFMMTLSLMMMFNFSTDVVMASKWIFLDNMSIILTILSLWISSMMMSASLSIKKINNKPNMLIMGVTILLIILVGAFTNSNILIFYILFEASLIPTMVLIMTWGYQPERLTASIYLLMYTVAASLPLLVSIMIMQKWFYSANMCFLLNSFNPYSYTSLPLWLMMILAFMVKLPMYLTHLWLPKAHVEAPVAGSMILAAVLLKLGGYGLIRMSQIFPSMNNSNSLLFISISMAGAVITGFICLRQADMKCLIAYSSVGHMGLLIAGVCSSSKLGMSGSISMMIAHAFSSSAMFIMANFTYEKFNTRSLFMTKGLLMLTPMMTFWWLMFIISNMAAPPSYNLMSEVMLMISISYKSLFLMPLLMIISFITAAYSWILYTMINHGKPNISYSSNLMINESEYLLLVMHITPMIIMLKPLLILV
nr:TPA: NADH dehydrogenase subunit 4 [Cirrodrilus suzukii]